MSQRLHVCKKCGKKFATLKGVYGHQRIHSGNYNRIEDDNGLQKIWGLKKSRVCSVSASDRFKGSSCMTEIEKHEVIEAAMNLAMLSQRVYDFASIRNLPLGDDFMDLELKPCPLRRKLQKKTQSSYKCRICDKSFVCSQALGSHQRLHRSMKGHLVRKREYIEEDGSLLDSSEANMIVSQPSCVQVSQEKILHCAESKLDHFSEQLAHSDFDKSSSCRKTRFSALHSPMRSKSHSSYRFKICGKSFGSSQALGGYQTLHRSIKGQLACKKENNEDDNSLSDSLEAKNIVTQPSSFEVSEEEKSLQCVEPKLEFHELLAHSGFDKSSTFSKTRFTALPSAPDAKKSVSQPSSFEVSEEEKSLQCVEPKLEFHELLAHSGFDKSSTFSKTRFTALPSAPDAKKSVSQPSSFEASVDEIILHRVEQKLEFSKQLPHSWFDKSSSCSKTNSALDSPLRSKSHSSYRFKICGKSFVCSKALGGHQTLHRSEDGNSLSGVTDSEASKIVSQPSSYKSQGI
ncbi:Zinc finger C2H2-type [Arabidopsis thaliana x Arabidopsis arenosa]|uniref:Zinc finger C2H2-type n=1 Tax=Arabidopsis thaliana x Arabidopsis arenosa TaxID=1240361 RepID=A0A8T1ZIW2_9BRAS|nr:Zinc finger C2H2-type [Arabidopsis thaliana x Arabidopsis arenosa]